MKILNLNFENPNKTSLNELILTTEDGKYKALHQRWLQPLYFTKYQPLIVKDGKLENGTSELVQSMEDFNNSLISVLKLNYHRFWCHVVFDKELINNIVYFLQESIPFYLPLSDLSNNQNVIKLYQKIAENVMRIICRLITNKESEIEWMPKDYLAGLLYKDFIISIPMLFDMIALYGPKNHNLLKKILDTLIKIEPKYLEDLKAGIKFIQSTFSTMQQELENIASQDANLSKKYEDLTLYLINIAATINLIIDLVPTDIKKFCTQTLKLEQSISNFYDAFIPNLYQNVFMMNPNCWFLNYVNYARIELINCYRNLLNRNIESILGGNQKNHEKAADEFLSVLTESAGHHVFVTDYCRIFPIECDLDIVEQSCKNIDTIKLDFVKGAFVMDRDHLENGFGVSGNQQRGKNSSVEDDDYDCEGARALSPVKEIVATVPENMEEKMITETTKVAELFPDYGTGFIRKLLARYDCNAENVIARILESNLDEDLLNCDQTEPYIPPEVLDPVMAATGIERLNIYDGDEFDVMRRDEFGGLVKKHGKDMTGKEPRNLNELLNDKSHVQALKNQYQKYTLVSDLNEDDAEYDDEYDDSYDAMVESEPKIKLEANMKNVLVDDVGSDSESEDEREATEGPSKANNLDFCENPELIRARREQHYQEKVAKKHPQRKNEWKNPTRDVVGNAKGQGQSDEVLRNRQFKNTNKSSRANHNRKQGASYKQNKGMF